MMRKWTPTAGKKRQSLWVALVAVVLVLDILVAFSLIGAEAPSGGMSSRGVCLSFSIPKMSLSDCGTFVCSGDYNVADNGICLLRSGYCENTFLREKIKMHDCSTYLW